jgi:HlyD family secretion protein
MPANGNNRNSELRSDEIEDILGRSPRGITRWGITFLLLILAALLAGSWFFSYPDLIPAEVEVTSENPPAFVAAKATAKLERLLVEDKQMVDSGQYLAILENPAIYIDVFELKSILDSLEPLVRMYDLSVIDTAWFNRELTLGELQPYYMELISRIQDYSNYQELDYYNKKIKSLKDELWMYNELVKRLTDQQTILDEDRKLKKKDYERYQQLHDSSVVADAQIEQLRSDYLQKELNYEESRAEISNARIQTARIQQSILDLSLQDEQQRKTLQIQLTGAYHNLLARIGIWQQTFVLKSPVRGTVSYNQYWIENQNVNEGDKVMAVVPVNETRIIGKLKLGVQRAGKVKTGQDVNIKFQSYPYMEFGMVRGQVSKISLVPSEDQFFLVEVVFPSGLRTNYGIDLEFSQKMTGQAEIITEEIPLMIRIIMPLKSLFKNRLQRPQPQTS